MRAVRRALFAAGLLTAAPLALAQQVSAPFTTSAMVVRGCAIATNDLAFGTYQAMAMPPDVLATTTVTVTCELGDTFTIGMSDGANPNGQQRRMARVPASGAYLDYNLFRDPARTLPWRDSGPTRMASIGTGMAQSFTVYGQLPGGQIVPAGPYVDTVTVTVRN